MSEPRTPKLAPRTPGFTIVELLIVVAIIGVLAALSVMTFREQMIRWKLREGTEIIAREIDRARSDARTENELATVTLAVGDTSITSSDRNVSLPSGVEVATAPSEPWLLFVPPYGAAFVSSDATYDFGGDSSFQAETIEVAWSPTPERTRGVTVVGVLGKAVLQ